MNNLFDSTVCYPGIHEESAYKYICMDIGQFVHCCTLLLLMQFFLLLDSVSGFTFLVQVREINGADINLEIGRAKSWLLFPNSLCGNL